MSWTDVPKPNDGGLVTIKIGMATGLLIPPTYAVSREIDTDKWVPESKPSDSSWTDVAKPTT